MFTIAKRNVEGQVCRFFYLFIADKYFQQNIVHQRSKKFLNGIAIEQHISR